MNVAKCESLNSTQCRLYLFSVVYKTGLGHFDLKLEQGLFQFDINLVVSVYKAEQILGIEPSSFFVHLCQMLPITYHYININVIKPNHNSDSVPEGLFLLHSVSHAILMVAKVKLVNNL